MRQRVTIQAATASTSAYGDVTRTWSSTGIGTLWAQVETEGGTETYTSGAERTEERAIFRIRYRSDLTEKDHRLLYPASSTSSVWDIESAINVNGLDRITELRAVKRG